MFPKHVGWYLVDYQAAQIALGAGLCLYGPGSGRRCHVPLSPKALSQDWSPQLGSVTAAFHRREKPLKADFSAFRVKRNGTGKERGCSSLRCSTPSEKRSRQLPPSSICTLAVHKRGESTCVRGRFREC